ncbi:PAS domain-containing sensor histidine kinase [Aequorivita lipolytica]|uniref:histidine kinase n=1 Tax=Aequorivita lipolytica TaxID=153267 RepID=A0A5C6YRJ7_9FLAO|nr:PAS domain-containing sensor histidine kinase [Aequorivita lipolytica]TXD69512.1 PAS domain S-box protein [Aequorivita lipolytica]SRX50991.1 Signal transduction histidine-protein kinase BarA [Aequorivita lipolytica]
MKVFEEKKGNIFKILSEAISEGIVIVNAKQEIVTSNEAADIMFGYDPKELFGQNLNVLIPRGYRENHHHQVDEFLDKSDPRQMGHGRDLYGQRKNGSVFPVEAGLNPFEIYGSKYVMALVTDISVRKNQEKEILELNLYLEQKIEERTRELNKTIKVLQEEVAKRKEAEHKMKESLRKERELNELKTKFLSLVSHEFKTPLSGILTSATLAGKYTETEQQDKREKHLKTIQSKVKYLNNILNDFLSIERLESGKATYKFDTFPLSKVVNEVIYNSNMLLKDGQRINYPNNIDDITVNFDEKILELSLTNLINNAIKYSPEYTTIDVAVVNKNETIVIQIKDEGMGIPQKEQKYIFNRYFRAENALLDQGTGIGLNIVKSHLESLGGKITFESEEGKGSAFTISFSTKNNTN